MEMPRISLERHSTKLRYRSFLTRVLWLFTTYQHLHCFPAFQLCLGEVFDLLITGHFKSSQITFSKQAVYLSFSQCNTYYHDILLPHSFFFFLTILFLITIEIILFHPIQLETLLSEGQSSLCIYTTVSYTINL